MPRYRFNQHHRHREAIRRGVVVIETTDGHGLAITLPGSTTDTLSLEGHVYDAPDLLLVTSKMSYTLDLRAAADRVWMYADFEDIFRRVAEEQAAITTSPPELMP